MDDRLVRSKSVTFTGVPGTSWSVAFDEVGALDNTHLLVLIVALSSTTATITTPAGWSRASATTPIFAIQGDGAINGVTVMTTSVSEVTLTLLAFEGFVSATSLARQVNGWSASAASTAQTITPGWIGSYGVVIQAVEAAESMTGATWSTLGFYAWSNGEANTARMRSVRQEWNAAQGISGPDTVVQFAAPVTTRRAMYALYPLTEVNHTAAAPPEVGPLVAWGFNEGSGDYSASRGSTAVDMKALQNPWTPDGHYGAGSKCDPALVPSVFGAIDPARASTAPDKIVAQGATLLQTFTVMAWMYVEAYPVTFNMVAVATTTTAIFGVTTTGQMTPIGAMTSPYTFPIGAWTHVAFTLDGPTNVGRFYINGVELVSNSTLTTLLGAQMQVNGLWQRASLYGLGQAFLGRVDDVRVFDTVLTASQITDWMNTPVTNSTTHDLDGEVPVLSEASGEVALIGGVDGEVEVVSNTEGDLSYVATLVGTAPVLSGSQGWILRALGLEGLVPILSGSSGTIHALRHVEGEVPVLTEASGEIAARLGAVGTVSVLSGASGTPRSIQVFEGTVPILVQTEGAISSRERLWGTVAVISDTEGDIVVHVGLRGTVVVLSQTWGHIQAPRQPVTGPLTLIPSAPRYGLCGEVVNLDLIGDVRRLTLEGSYE